MIYFVCTCVCSVCMSPCCKQLLTEAHEEKHTKLCLNLDLSIKLCRELNNNKPGKSCNNSLPT